MFIVLALLLDIDGLLALGIYINPKVGQVWDLSKDIRFRMVPTHDPSPRQYDGNSCVP